MAKSTNKIIQNAINITRSVYTAMDIIANATTLNWTQINNAIEKARAAREPINELLIAAADADRDISSQFTIEIGSPYTILDMQTVFVTSSTQTETFNDFAFALFDANNTRERVLFDPNDANSDRIIKEIVFGSPDIDSIKTSAAAIATTLADFAP